PEGVCLTYILVTKIFFVSAIGRDFLSLFLEDGFLRVESIMRSEWDTGSCELHGRIERKKLSMELILTLNT
ncbi:hypothetical protein MKX01_025908, partial [Papaver californicum]